MRSRIVRITLSAACLTVLSVGTASALQVPAEYQGDWVAAQATCESPVRFRIEAARMTFINGADTESFGDVEMGGATYWGPDYKGIVEVAISEFSGDQPVMAMFNAGEKRGVAQVEFATPSPGARNAAVVALNARYTKLNLAKRFPLGKVPLKKCPARGASAQPVTSSAAVAGPRGAQPPSPAQSLCTGQRFCDEVPAFAATVTDFRPSLYDQSTRVVSATVRFQNKSARPLILGYIRTAAVAINEAGNRYTVTQPANVRGIGEIAGGQFDPKFMLAPGQSADTRFEFTWSWNGRDIIGQRAWDIDLAVREVNEVAPGQYRFAQEHPLQFKGLAPSAMTGAPPAGGALATVPGGSVTPGIPTPAPAPDRPVAQIPPNEPDACAGRPRCYDAGPFVAEIVNATGVRQQLARPWHSVSLNLRFRNKTTEPITLGYVHGSAVVIDDLGNRYVPAAAPEDVKGMGRVQANRADPQFVLRPGETRAATFGLGRVMRGTPNATVVGSGYTFDLSIAQLEVIYNGQQVRTLREHALTFPSFGLGGGATGAAAAPGGTNTDAESIKKAGEAIRNIFKK